ncbi:50S ribosomal protein L14 [Candidatus Roizmanbacteria bacterium RIFCSPLOWO2_12_FULL_40_12]|uniref:Large ribosomal subunit protein uL14 n=1 Tax=Candidatus Roizmanbacteria bacterium RIFCSPLOWO2_01_FULL_40_42 TaxID=1802066 RepID=A0A1F7J4H5_9BACT|nr:MAG: 50S ribosomal protein L14 [Candidatus Roizmanbacteria bacterium RIFCSPHIGHO2_01_FULL_40_98]OGK27280.1 MAG: 50S ribosomal protein L14 [Candidatus Roizmanbacteria bacterium RIFCSPHIGHO2_02_FULL_40_53]OGK30848.1 MAG: 50S ribosomal protein L14 [Candidatus Roizmanbacteria bacterium RIFCSPHIGHO2_12_41_18]OGK36385.1 MAG: 50S ribosomal protein L14 [Candidatus Roizmanbacteria bacterium RIFCSPHIGHO2_12_FULL_40_130]OGK50513.1 MAG: 50S ribosomal protein L14 [Candidatus Roizmanbacteria bacterium RIF
MLQLRSMLGVADNTGAKKVQMIGMPKRGNKKFAAIGDVIIVVIKEAIPYAQVKKSEVVPVVIVRSRKEKRRKDGSYIRFDDNACVILQAKDSKEPRGTRIFGPIAKEIKDSGFNKIASLAEEVY